MAIVVDASLLVRLASGGELAPEIDTRIAGWLTSGEELHAPHLLFYEVESGLRRMVFDGKLSEARAISRLGDVAAIAITLHPHPPGGRLLRMADRQRTRAAYDAAYLVLAEALPAELWTVDRRLANSGRSLGIRTNDVGDPTGRG
ncbi:MAG: type II toxin-antitoxin system VapC family toxin [Thermoleophilia bacterium]